MGTGSRSAYFDAAITLLAERGPRALTMQELCGELGLTTGSFYRHFANWADFKSGLLDDWLETRTLTPFAESLQHPDPRQAMASLIEYACALPHRTEAALRSWSLADPEVASVQARIDRTRVESTTEALGLLVLDRTLAGRYAAMGQFVLIGFQQAHVQGDPELLRWALNRVYDDCLAAAVSAGVLVEKFAEPLVP